MNVLGKRSVSSLFAIFLNVAWYAVAVALALTGCLLVSSPFIDLSSMRLTIPVSFSLDTGAHPVTPLSPSSSDASTPRARMGGEPGFGFEIDDESNNERRFHVRGSLKFPTPSRALFAANAAVFLTLLSLILWTIGQLRAVFRTLRDGNPFVPVNATRIRRVAYAVILVEIGRTAAVFFENAYAVTHFSATGVQFDAIPDLNVFAIIYGLIILVIAEVFSAGSRLDEEQSLTI